MTTTDPGDKLTTRTVSQSQGPASGIPASGIPARGMGTRPPFSANNAAGLRHGTHSPRVYLPLAHDLAAGLLDEHPDLAAYRLEVDAWAEWETRALLMRRHLATVGYMDDNGEPRKGPTQWLKTCEDRAARARASLGLTPFAEAALAKDRAAASLVAVDLAAIAERGRQALAARAAADNGHELTAPDPAAAVLAEVAAQGRESAELAAAAHYAATGLTPPPPATTGHEHGHDTHHDESEDDA